MEEEGEHVETIFASDLLKLMQVVEMATGLYNVLEHRSEVNGGMEFYMEETFGALGDALRALGLQEVQP